LYGAIICICAPDINSILSIDGGSVIVVLFYTSTYGGKDGDEKDQDGDYFLVDGIRLLLVSVPIVGSYINIFFYLFCSSTNNFAYVLLTSAIDFY